MDEMPTDREMADVFNSLMFISERYGMIYGSPRQTINKVLRFWGKLGLQELEKLEAAKYQPKMRAPHYHDFTPEEIEYAKERLKQDTMACGISFAGGFVDSSSNQ